MSELINLKLASIYLEESKIHIVAAKGKKDRYVTLAERTKKLIKIYTEKYAPEKYLIEGQKGGQYTASSIRKFLNKYTVDAGITKKVTGTNIKKEAGEDRQARRNNFDESSIRFDRTGFKPLFSDSGRTSTLNRVQNTNRNNQHSQTATKHNTVNVNFSPLIFCCLAIFYV
mgnify:CR=1 FL=1